MEKKTLHLLILEDNADDAELAVQELERQGFIVEWSRVETGKAFREALDENPDLILADYGVPSFGGTDTLKMQQEIAPQIPLVIISGIIDEEVAVECMKSGAVDYVLKDRLFRLGQVVKRALEEAEVYRERKQAEEELNEAQRYTRGLIEASLDALVTISAESKITDVNRETELITGISRKEIIGTDFSSCYTDPDTACKCFQQVFQDGYVRDCLLEIKHRDGKVTPVLCNASIYQNAQGRVAGVFAAARDITESRKLEEQLRQAQKMEAVGTLAGGITHDFNNLLTGILGGAQLLLMKLPADSTSRGWLHQIEESGNRAAELTDQLLTISHRQPPAMKPTNINQVVAKIVRLLQRSIPENIDVQALTEPAVPIIASDEGQLRQVLMNLGVNARDAMPEGGKLTFNTWLADRSDLEMPGILSEVADGYVCISVTDTGVGMDEETQQRIFEPFFTTKQAGKGTGLGLSIVYKAGA